MSNNSDSEDNGGCLVIFLFILFAISCNQCNENDNLKKEVEVQKRMLEMQYKHYEK